MAAPTAGLLFDEPLLEQIRAKDGPSAPIDEARMLQDIIDRDRSDSSRAVGPLVCPEDALRVNTSALGFEQVVNLLEDHVRERIGSL